jgi:PPOX class probable F420-dependent enzyme
MALDIDTLDDSVLTFLRERHLATLTTLRTDGSPHVVAVGFSYDVEAQVARVITWGASQKSLNAARMQVAGQRAAVCQVDGGRWLSLEGQVRLVADPIGIQPGVHGYAARYQQPKERDDRTVIEIDVDRILGRG